MAAIRASLGPVAGRVFSPPRWTDAYPAWPEYAAELETLIAFVESQKQLPRFAPRLNTPRNNQRDEALNEIRVASLLHRNGFPILGWDPAGNHGKIGEYLVGTPEGMSVFTEIKSPGWEGELSGPQRHAGRTRLPKYIDGEGRAYANWKGMRDCIARAYRKFAAGTPNLLVIADDFFVSLTNGQLPIDVALYVTHSHYGNEPGYFASAAYENLGGVAVFATAVARAEVQYVFRIFENPFALPNTKLPSSLLQLRS